MSKKLVVISVIGIAFLVGIFVFLYVIYPSVQVTINPTPDKITLENQSSSTSVIKTRLFIGKHKLSATKEGFPELIETIQVKPGKNNFSYKMKSAKDIYIDSLPETTADWNITYSNLDEKFFIQILQGPYAEKLTAAKNHIKEQGIDIGAIKIYSWPVAGVK